MKVNKVQSKLVFEISSKKSRFTQNNIKADHRVRLAYSFRITQGHKAKENQKENPQRKFVYKLILLLGWTVTGATRRSRSNTGG